MTSQGTVNTLTVSGFASAIQRADGQANLSNWELSNGALTPIDRCPLECTIAEDDTNLYFPKTKGWSDHAGDIRQNGMYNDHNCNDPPCTPFYFSAKHPMMSEDATKALNDESLRQGIRPDPSRWKLVSVKLFPEQPLADAEFMERNHSREADEADHGKPCNSLLTFGVFDEEGLSRHIFDNGPICQSNFIRKVSNTFNSSQVSGDLGGPSVKSAQVRGVNA